MGVQENGREVFVRRAPARHWYRKLSRLSDVPRDLAYVLPQVWVCAPGTMDTACWRRNNKDGRILGQLYRREGVPLKPVKKKEVRVTHARLYDNSRRYVRFIYNVRLMRRRSMYSYCRSSPRGFGGRAVAVSEKIMQVTFSMHQLLTLANLRERLEI